MKTQQWSYVDKSEWHRGPWDKEPDKLQWQDKATGLPCLIVRGPHGGWCGYVAVSKPHPWHGIDYSSCVKGECEESWCGHSPNSSIDVHGGLTFASRCIDVGRGTWEKWRHRINASHDEARRFLVGDAARYLRERGPFVDDYEGWAAKRSNEGVCHVVESGDPDDVWWFGFDCAHAGDVSPAFERDSSVIRADSYKTLDYVQGEVGKLAKQLSERT